MSDDEFCLDCPDEVRGKCCHIGMPLGNYNVILDHTYCPHLNKGTGLCSIYDTRLETASWCLTGEDLFGTGALPKGCLYLKDKPELESNPKQSIFEIIKTLNERDKAALVMMYNTYNNILFEDYIKFTEKNKQSKEGATS